MAADKTRTKKWAPKTFNGCLTCKYVYLDVTGLFLQWFVADNVFFAGEDGSSVTKGNRHAKGLCCQGTNLLGDSPTKMPHG